jgi:hypothetical protein
MESHSGRGEVTHGCLLLNRRDEEEREEKEMSSKEAGAEVAHRGRELGGKTPMITFSREKPNLSNGSK